MNTYTFSDRVQDIPDAGIGSIMYYARQYKDTISLGQGAPNFPTPQCIYDEIHRLSKIDPNLGMYNTVNDSYHMKVKLLLQKEFEKEYGFSPDPTDFYLTVGGIGGLYATLMAVTQKGDEVIYFDPSYPLHLSQLALSQATPVFVPYDEKNNWRPNLELLKTKITSKTKAIVLTNPNNPTGTVFTKEEVRLLANIVIEHDLYLILDEAYSYLTYDTKIISPMIIPELRDHIILSKSFSKEYAMTGWRIGYLWVKQPIREKIHQVHLYFSINPATIAIKAAEIALSHHEAKKARLHFIEEITRSRTAILARLAKLNNQFDFVPPNGAFYMFPRVKIPHTSVVDFAKLLIKETGVITIPGDSMGPSGAHHLRISFCAPEQVIESAFDRLDTYFKVG
jgi:aminotransferase